MRIQRLDLRAFGPFTGHALDLSAGPPALHVVHGPNEAGKSTARRALEQLLYGIPPRSSDDFLHPYKDLRIGAVLRAGDGTELEVVRRKGNKNTLRDADEQVLDEAELSRFLRGVNLERFQLTFAIDHVTLRKGADDLKKTLGDAGESLFDAALGGSGVHRVLQGLREEREELWVPRGNTRVLAKAISAFRKAQKEHHDSVLSAAELREQREHIDQLRADVARCAGERDEGRRELRGLREAVAVVPLLRQRATHLASRAALGALPELPADVTAQRERAEREQAEAAAQLGVHQTEGGRLRAALEQIAVRDALLEVSVEELEDLERALGRHRADLAERPSVASELEEVEARLRAELRRLGSDAPLDEAASLVPGSLAATGVDDLAETGAELTRRRDAAREELLELDARLDGLRAAPDDDGRPSLLDSARLDELAERVRGLGDVSDRQRRDLEALRKAELERDAAWSALEPRGPDVEQTLALEAPSAEQLTGFAAERAALDDRQHDLARRRADQQERADQERQKLGVEQAGGEVPDEDALSEARSARDEHWQRIRAGADPAGQPGERFERSLHETDELADRMRREATRVASVARARAACEHAEQRLRELDQEQAELDADRARHDEAWQAVWSPSGLPAGEPAARQAWSAERQALAARQLGVSAAADDVRALEQQLDELTQAIASALAELGRAPDGARPDGDPLTAFQVASSRLASALAERDELRRQTEQRASELRQAEAERREAQARLADVEGRLEAWSGQWREALQPLGLSGDTTRKQARERLDSLRDLDGSLEARGTKLRRLQRMDADEGALAERVAELLQRAPLAAGADPGADAALELRAQAVLGEHRGNRAAADKQAERRAELEANEQASSEARRKRDLAAARLDELMRLAGVGDVDALRRVEAGVVEARALDERLARLDRSIAEAGYGVGVDELAARHGEADVAAAQERIEELEAREAALQDQLDALRTELVRREDVVERQSRADASALAVEAQGQLARVRELARRWATRRLAEVLLEREVERFRETHQNPVLQRAGELFERISEGRYGDLRAVEGDHDKQVLRCRDPDGESLGVDALSDGTRDQLYLALRVASLEHQARHDEPFPLIADDVLVHFDDTRTRLALQVLGELAATTQVILFTHHARVLELARDALPAGVLVEHELDALERGPVS